MHGSVIVVMAVGEVLGVVFERRASPFERVGQNIRTRTCRSAHGATLFLDSLA